MARAVCMLPQRLDECVQYAHFPLCPVGHAAREAREVLGAPTSLLAQHGIRRLVVSRVEPSSSTRGCRRTRVLSATVPLWESLWLVGEKPWSVRVVLFETHEPASLFEGARGVDQGW